MSSAPLRHVLRTQTKARGMHSLVSYGAAVLNTSDLVAKMELTMEAKGRWCEGSLPLATRKDEGVTMRLMDHPARPDKPVLVEDPAADLKKRQNKENEKTAVTESEWGSRNGEVGRKETKRARQRRPKIPLNISILHSLAHIELTAVDMYWDTLVRFHEEPFPEEDVTSSSSSPSPSPSSTSSSYLEPEGKTRLYFDDLMSVISDEARHFTAVSTRLQELDSFYGALDAHKALWHNAVITQDSLPARLALVPLVQEARGLEAGPRLVTRLISFNDHPSAAIVQMIVDEERGHVEFGQRWFGYLCSLQGLEPASEFNRLVSLHFPSDRLPSYPFC